MRLRYLALAIVALFMFGCENDDKNQAPSFLFSDNNFVSSVGTTGPDAEVAEGTWSATFIVTDDGRSSNAEGEVFESGVLVGSITLHDLIVLGGGIGASAEVTITKTGNAVEGDAKLSVYSVAVSIDFETSDPLPATVQATNAGSIQVTIEISDGGKTDSITGTINVSRLEDPAA